MFVDRKRKRETDFLNKGNIFTNFAALIAKDTKAQNESKKTIVVIRIILISIIIYFSLTISVGKVISDVGSAVFFLSFFIIFAGFFACTYRFRTIVVLWMFNIGMFFFIIFNLRLFGWNIGVQHFLMVMLLLYFFSSYKRHKEKFIYAAALCALRLILFHTYYKRTPVVILLNKENEILQSINTIAIFWCISVIAYIFSRDSQELEGKLVDYNEQLQKQAKTDTLTGLCNRRGAKDYLEWLTRGGEENKGFCLCICDIDFFKKVNDTYGHDFGDEVLKGIAGIFKEEMTGRRLAARWGGEEFLLLFSEYNGDEACVYLESIKRRIKAMRIVKDGYEVGVTMTFGLAEYDFSGDAENTLKEADKKLYQGKEAGRDRIIY